MKSRVLFMVLASSLALSACGGSGGDNAGDNSSDNSGNIGSKDNGFVFTDKHDAHLPYDLIEFTRMNGFAVDSFEFFYPKDGMENAGKPIGDKDPTIADLGSRIVNFSSSTHKGIPFKTKTGAPKEGHGSMEIYSNGFHSISVVRFDQLPEDENGGWTPFYFDRMISITSTVYQDLMRPNDIYDVAKASGNKLRYEGKGFVFGTADFKTNKGDMIFDFEVNKKDGDKYEITAEGSVVFPKPVNPMIIVYHDGKDKNSFQSLTMSSIEEVGNDITKINFHKTSKTFLSSDSQWLVITDMDFDGKKVPDMRTHVYIDGAGAKSMFGYSEYNDGVKNIKWMGLLGNKK